MRRFPLNCLVFLAIINYIFFLFFFIAVCLSIPQVIIFVQNRAYFFDPPTMDLGQLQLITTEAEQKVFLQSSPTSLLGAAETRHLQDVHAIIMIFFGCAMVSLAIICLIKFFKLRIFSRKIYLIAAGVLTILTLGMLIIFPTFFAAFHWFFFPQGNYTFPATSPLIQAFPLSFWYIECGLLLGGVISILLFQAWRAKPTNF